ncbi:helix-turn-helix domain-containing protein [Streptomyces phaeochromogenes]|uniref:helix-turn-helix domain-containing protein n=1 Tax=Streptomyces phaeochromogenes TaxID=1923 RepID=UPI0036CAE201
MYVATLPPEHELISTGSGPCHRLSRLRRVAVALAAVAGASERHLSRVCVEHGGHTPGRLVRHARTAPAAHLLTSTHWLLAGAAMRCGFGSAETSRQAFVSQQGIPSSRNRATQAALPAARRRRYRAEASVMDAAARDRPDGTQVAGRGA